MEDPSGTAMPTLGQHPSREEPRFVPESTSPEKPSPQKHADPPAFPPAVPSMRFDSTPVEGDHPLVQEGPRSINQRGGEAAASSSVASRGSDPSGVSYQSHQTPETHFTAGSGSGPDFKDQVRGFVDNSNNNIVFAENVRAVPMSVAPYESLSHSHDEEKATPVAPPHEDPPATSPDPENQPPPPRAPLPQADGGRRRCSKRTLIIVALIVICVVGVVGGVVGVMSGSSSSSNDDNNKSPGPPVDEGTEAPVETQAPTTQAPTTQAPTTQAPTPVARDIAIVEFIQSITFSDSVIAYPQPSGTPEEMAVIWLIDNTSLSAGDPSDEFRLTQKYALLVLYYATQGDAWTNNVGWLDSTTDECNWSGITCDDDVLVNESHRTT